MGTFFFHVSSVSCVLKLKTAYKASKIDHKRHKSPFSVSCEGRNQLKQCTQGDLFVSSTPLPLHKFLAVFVSLQHNGLLSVDKEQCPTVNFNRPYTSLLTVPNVICETKRQFKITQLIALSDLSRFPLQQCCHVANCS